MPTAATSRGASLVGVAEGRETTTGRWPALEALPPTHGSSLSHSGCVGHPGPSDLRKVSSYWDRIILAGLFGLSTSGILFPQAEPHRSERSKGGEHLRWNLTPPGQLAAANSEITNREAIFAYGQNRQVQRWRRNSWAPQFEAVGAWLGAEACNRNSTTAAAVGWSKTNVAGIRIFGPRRRQVCTVRSYHKKNLVPKKY